MIALAEAPPRPEPAAAAGPESPYKFLDYFADTELDRRRFGGRDREIRELVARITNEPTLVLCGPSGIGKTSLLLAGVFPALRERGYRPVYARVLTSPLADLLGALGEPAGGCATAARLREVLARWTRESPVAIVLDQFEELFIRFRERPEERKAFIDALAAAIADPAIDLAVVFSLREDYMFGMNELSCHLPRILEDRYHLQPLTAFGVRQAITKPLVDARIPFEPAVISRLIAQLEEVSYEPPLLQILCSELYKEAARRTGGGVPKITVADLEQLGGRDGIFRRYLTGVTEAIPAGRHLLCRMMLDALITWEGTKRAVTLADLLASGFAAEPGEVEELLDLLTAQRLVRREERGGEVWYELIHERLVPVLREWLDLDRPFFEFRQARTWVRNNSESDLWRQSSDILLSQGALANLLGPFRERFRFTERELELVVRSALYRQSDQLPFWAGLYGLERTKGFLHEMLAASRDGERRAAAGSARLLDDVDGRLAAACLHAALEDASEGVRREAALSLARLARPEEIEALCRCYRQRTKQERVREILAAMHEGGHPLHGFNRFRRWLARRREDRRKLNQKSGAVRLRWLAGMAYGAAAGVVWVCFSLTFDLLADFLADPSTFDLGIGGGSDLWEPIKGMGTMLVLAPVIGALLSWLPAMAVAREAALRGEERWAAALVRRPFLVLGWMALFVVSAYSGIDSTGLGSSRIAGVLGFLAVLSVLLLASAVWHQPCVGPRASKAEAWMSSLVASLGLPLLALFVLATAVRRTLLPDFLAGSVLPLARFAACASFVLLVALGRSAARRPLGQVPGVSTRRRWSRVALAAGTGAVAWLWFGHFYGFDLLVPKILDYDPARPFSHSWRPGTNRVDPPTFEIRNRSGVTHVVEIATEQSPENGLGVVRLGSNAPILPGETMTLPPGRHSGGFIFYMPAADEPMAPGDNRGAGFTLHPRSRRPRLDPERLQATDPVKADWLVPVPVPGAAGEGHVVLRGIIDPGLLGPTTRIDQIRIRVAAWSELLVPGSGTKLRIRALGPRGALIPNEVPERMSASILPKLDILPGQEVAVPLGKKLGFSLPDIDKEAVNWLVQPDAQGRWSIEIRLREVPPGKPAAGARHELFVAWHPFTLPG